ncbi:MAG: PTS sugar transporter subunit IIA [Verrucomicrobiota bacterium]|nr:PTS sugar transporter subunit IIA [Verrucomicrobiota bacterium]
MYLNLIQIAESFGVSEKVVHDWIKNEGLPRTTDHDRLLFDRAQVAEWATSRGLTAHAGFLAPEAQSLAGSWKLAPLLRAGGIWRDIPADGVLGVFEKVVSALPAATPAIRQLLQQRIRMKDGITWSPVGKGIALPHLRTRVTLGRESGTVALLLLRTPLTPGEPLVDTVPLTCLFFFLAPSPRAHLDMLGRLSRLLTKGGLSQLLLSGASDEVILQSINETESALADTVQLGVKP